MDIDIGIEFDTISTNKTLNRVGCDNDERKQISTVSVNIDIGIDLDTRSITLNPIDTISMGMGIGVEFDTILINT